jgi:plastocyanin
MNGWTKLAAAVVFVLVMVVWSLWARADGPNAEDCVVTMQSNMFRVTCIHVGSGEMDDVRFTWVDGTTHWVSTACDAIQAAGGSCWILPMQMVSGIGTWFRTRVQVNFGSSDCHSIDEVLAGVLESSGVEVLGSTCP